jgi:hypothetical protein
MHSSCSFTNLAKNNHSEYWYDVAWWLAVQLGPNLISARFSPIDRTPVLEERVYVSRAISKGGPDQSTAIILQTRRPDDVTSY